MITLHWSLAVAIGTLLLCAGFLAGSTAMRKHLTGWWLPRCGVPIPGTNLYCGRAREHPGHCEHRQHVHPPDPEAEP